MDAAAACAAECVGPLTAVYVVARHIDPRRARRIHKQAETYGALDRPLYAYRFASRELGAERVDREHAWIIFLDIYAMYAGSELLAIGTRDRVSFELPDVLRAAGDNGSKYVVLVHNHPSGYAEPSDADMNLTGSLAELCAASGLLLIDHLIVAPAGDEYFSFRENRLCRAAA